MDGGDVEAAAAVTVPEQYTPAAPAPAPVSGAPAAAAAVDSAVGTAETMMHGLTVVRTAPKINVEAFSAKVGDVTIYFQLIRMEESCYAWVRLSRMGRGSVRGWQWRVDEGG
jgi:hypothetical protein